MKKRPSKSRKPETSEAELSTCLDYLHGEVVGDEFRAACQYEYARESAVLQKAAQMLMDNPTADEAKITFQVEREFRCGAWFINTDWSFMWLCPSFPTKSWNQLNDEDRTELLYALPLSTTKARALRLGEVIFLTHFLAQFQELADKAHAEWKEARAAGRQRQKVYPVLELRNTPLVQALLPLDFSKSKTRLLREIGEWLEMPDNKTRLERHKPKTEE